MTNIRFHKTLLKISLGIIFIIAINACEKFDQISTNPNLKLNFSSDSIVFDTVFTSVGSITKRLLIHNLYGENLSIEEISLAKGVSSAYRMNVDGISKISLNNVEIRAHDSLFVFIRVLINPNDQNSPFIVEDNIEFITNGNHQSIKLLSWGQNAHYIIADQETSDGMHYKSIAQSNEVTVWDNSKPYLIYGFAKVDSAGSLQITEGTQIHFHNNSGLWIENNAQLVVEGTLENRVVFQGDRLDEDYSDITHQWDKIWIEGSNESHQINYAVIKNGTTGLLLTNQTENDSYIEIANCEIENMNNYGINTSNFDILVYNNLITNAGKNLLYASGKGDLRIVHCTFANYWQHSIRNESSIYIDGESGSNSTIYLGNCIIDGNKSDELFILNADTPTFEFVFEYCSLKTNLNLSNESNYINTIQNPSDLFEDAGSQLYMLSATSEAIDQGKASLGIEFPFDLLNNNRSQSPDLGALEYSNTSKIK